MKLKTSVTLFLLAAITLSVNAQAAQKYDLTATFQQNVEAKRQGLAEIRKRLIARPTYVSPEAKDLQKVRDYFEHLSADGQFDDLPAKPPQSWDKGLARLNAMTVAFKKMSAEDQRALRNKLYAGILYYAKQAVASPDPFVGAAFMAPRNASAIYFSLYDDMQKPENHALAAALKDTLFMCWYWPVFHRDTHRKDNPHSLSVFLGEAHFIVGNTTYRPIVECAAALDDTKMMDVVHEITVRSLANRTSYQTEETSLWGEQGLTMDGNGMAHSRQSYIFGYVRDWFNGVCSIARFFRGTPWEIPPTSWDLTTNLVLDGQQWYVYKGDIDWSIAGRHNMYPGLVADGNAVLKSGIKQMLELGGDSLARKPELIALTERLDHNEEFAGNRYFWNVEDMVHRRPDYYMSVNLSSVRSNGPENAPPFSGVNYHFGFGSMMIKTKGDEYRRARGALNYTSLPGTTNNPTTTVTSQENWSGFHGVNTFCGGVSDGSLGVCGFMLHHDSLPSIDQQLWRIRAHKGYFFFDGGCVALGSDITTGHIETTVNQTEWRGDATYFDGSSMKKVDANGVHMTLPADQICWALNDGIGYLILPGDGHDAPKLTAETRTTRWAEIAESNAGKPEAAAAKEPIFQLSIPHSQDHDKYAYAILPSISAEQLSAIAAKPPFEVLANQSDVQAVRFADSGVIQVIFYRAGKLDCGTFTLSVDRAAILMLKPSGKNWQLFYSDPLQNEESRTLKIATTLAVAGENVRKSNDTAIITCEFPAKPWIGKTAHCTLDSALTPMGNMP